MRGQGGASGAVPLSKLAAMLHVVRVEEGEREGGGEEGGAAAAAADGRGRSSSSSPSSSSSSSSSWSGPSEPYKSVATDQQARATVREVSENAGEFDKALI